VAIFVAVTLANAAISYTYTKDVILSPAGIFYAAVFTVAVKALIETGSVTASRVRLAALTVFLVVLSERMGVSRHRHSYRVASNGRRRAQ
jgi:hypothetical protein